MRRCFASFTPEPRSSALSGVFGTAHESAYEGAKDQIQVTIAYYKTCQKVLESSYPIFILPSLVPYVNVYYPHVT